MDILEPTDGSWFESLAFALFKLIETAAHVHWRLNDLQLDALFQPAYGIAWIALHLARLWLPLVLIVVHGRRVVRAIGWRDAYGVVLACLSAFRSAFKPMSGRSGGHDGNSSSGLSNEDFLDLHEALETWKRAERELEQVRLDYFKELQRVWGAGELDQAESSRTSIEVVEHLQVNAFAATPDELDRAKHRNDLIGYFNILLGGIDRLDNHDIDNERRESAATSPIVFRTYTVARVLAFSQKHGLQGTRTVLQYLQRAFYVDFAVGDLRFGSGAACFDNEQVSLALIEQVESLITMEPLSKADIVALCMLYFDVYQAQRRFAVAEERLLDAVLAAVIARDGLKREARLLENR
ncbi:hypothetical protein NBRC10513v2_003253 [Rhodotorula toruloides]